MVLTDVRPADLEEPMNPWEKYALLLTGAYFVILVAGVSLMEVLGV